MERITAETKIQLSLNPYGKGTAEIDTGCGFLNHMLTLFARHGCFDLSVQCKGDTDVDYHHTTEDIAICLGQAFREAMGDKRGITRYGSILLPMDELLEYSPELYELLDLKAGKCRMCVAGPADFRDNRSRILRVATKFPRIAGDFYAEKSRDVELIKLNGSIELAPILGLSDVIVDIVETGRTLFENGLTVLEEVCPISARLVANPAAYRFRREEIDTLTMRLGAEIKVNGEGN